MFIIRKQLCIWFVAFGLISISCSNRTDEDNAPRTVQAPTSITIKDPISHLDQLAKEPMLIEHPSGALFVTGFNNKSKSPLLWKSIDGGVKWKRVDVGTVEDGAEGDSDVDLALAPDGTLFFITMGFGPSPEADTLHPWGRGTHITVGVSRDEGETWSWTYLSQDPFDDRPWIEVGPNGIAHAIWNDGAGVSHASSSDGGHTWIEHDKIHTLGGSSHLAVGPNSEVALRITPVSMSGYQYDEGVDLIAISTNGSHRWLKYTPPGKRDWIHMFESFDKIPRWVEPIAWDDNGVLYYIWSEGQELWLGRSIDQCKTWETWPVSHDSDRVFFPYLAAHGSGELACTWFTGRDETLRVHVAYIYMRKSDTEYIPQVIESEPFQQDVWTQDDTQILGLAGEYVPVAFLSDGSLAVVTAILNKQKDRWGYSWWRIELN